MNKLILIPVLILCLTYSLYAQKSDFTSPEYAGSKALLFEFEGLSLIKADNFEGGIGGKYFFTNNLAGRVGLQFGYSKETIPATVTPGFIGIDGVRSGTTFGISLAAEYHLSHERLSPFIGGGLGITTTSTDSKPSLTYPAGAVPPGQPETKDRIGGENVGGATYIAGTDFSVFGLVGIEYFITEKIGLSAEYRLSFQSLSEADEVDNGFTIRGNKVSQIQIASAGFITIAFYFD